MISLFLALLVSAPPEFEVQPLDGPRLAGRLVAMDAKQVTVETSSGRVSLELAKVATLAAKSKPVPPAAKVWVDLVDGSSLVAQEYTVHEGVARITLSGGDALELPVRELSAVRFVSGPEALAAQWADIRALKSQSDMLVVGKAKPEAPKPEASHAEGSKPAETATKVADNLDYHKGALGDVTATHAQFKLDGERLEVKRTKIYGLVYYHAAATPAAGTAAEGSAPEPAYTVLDAGGSRWSVRSLAFSDHWEWTTVGGRTVRRGPEQLASADLSRGKIVFLSDIEPESAIYTPLWGMQKELPSRLELFRPRQDQTMESKPLRIGGKTYAKGLWLHSRTEMIYRLPGRYSRFEAVAGIDDDVRPRGHVRLVIRGDDKVLLDATVSGSDKDAARPISLDLSGVHRLVILVDYGNDLDVAGHLDLGDARLIK
jgi:hypothetical protein